MKKLIDKLWLYSEELLTVCALVSLVITGFLINKIVGFAAVTLATAAAANLVIKYQEKIYSD